MTDTEALVTQLESPIPSNPPSLSPSPLSKSQQQQQQQQGQGFIPPPPIFTENHLNPSMWSTTATTDTYPPLLPTHNQSPPASRHQSHTLFGFNSSFMRNGATDTDNSHDYATGQSYSLPLDQDSAVYSAAPVTTPTTTSSSSTTAIMAPYPYHPDPYNQPPHPVHPNHMPVYTTHPHQPSHPQLVHPHAHAHGHAPMMQAPHQYYRPQPPRQSYDFVLPQPQQQKRPRRRYEEIERIYVCGHGGCQKGYGTLNHLNAHVQMQGHGEKRRPEEFKEVRRQYKAKKKLEEEQAKAKQREQERSGARPSSSSSSHHDSYYQPVVDPMHHGQYYSDPYYHR